MICRFEAKEGLPSQNKKKLNGLENIKRRAHVSLGFQFLFVDWVSCSMPGLGDADLMLDSEEDLFN